MSFLILRKEPIQNPICSVTYAASNRQHNSRTAERRAFKFPDENTERDETKYGANYFEKHKNTVSKNPLINNPPGPSILAHI